MPSKLTFPSTGSGQLPAGTTLPNHIVIIPDGDRRWARVRGLSAPEGHRAGIENMIKLAQTARDWGIHTVSVWGLSTENWVERPKKEVNLLMKGIAGALEMYLEDMQKDGVRLVHLGRKDRLPDFLLRKIAEVEKATRNNTRHVFNVGLDYNGWDEITRMTQKLVGEGIPAEKIDRKMLDSHMDTAGQPYPYIDLYIRTSGEQRTSGFMMWQADYAEFYWEPSYFPDFTPEKLREAILDYSLRRRRFGGNDAEAHLTFSPSLSARLELDWWRLRHVPDNTRFRDFVKAYIKEQYGLSKELTKDSAEHLFLALAHGNEKDWRAAKKSLNAFYTLIKDHLKLAFEPEMVASLKVDLWREAGNGAGEAMESLATNLTAEEYRISHFQAAKAGHLRVLAEREIKKAEGGSEVAWVRAYDYLLKYYQALKERVA
ncbi:di-trans,poly-cis-decaprenylcistransferase [Candidatus Woesebacteria bacterium RIFOXYA1_FULL_43_9]|uniref:Isoprenyl transferase n=1 Tax=Candidatus Woesebacteria bacterium RIFOXYA1_FULL_43_9 TaxID=1802534 RepID=A0A1F8CLK2_9BACT|nr:MAG: di-trans,poly-cis-decaprenylcistransferase [Candidatus Woesebacteria bacterium RIFOXYA1_FULL_43_9]